MIDPIHSLSFSMHTNPGIYAVLLGSGISREAKIPTGWEITLDLVRKLASISGEKCDPTPEDWYVGKYEKEPDYSELLDAIVKTPSERQQLLRTYWEPNDQEQEEGAKQPTLAHRAIAKLVAQGIIKVIITTNFDRLIESALTEIGVVPTIISSTDQIKGAMPLIHTKCCLFKLHGDYLDTRIRNTLLELETYPPEYDNLLDRIFDEFGLIVCGWSAKWDGALRNAITRTSSRRFTMFWTTQNDPSEEAKQLIIHRGAEIVRIENADILFQSIQDQVLSLEDYSRPHPLSIESAVGSIKRYLSESRYRIQYNDFVNKEIIHTYEKINNNKFSVESNIQINTIELTRRARLYEVACETLLSLALVSGYWFRSDIISEIWNRAIGRFANWPSISGSSFWLDFRKYPATLLLYALGIGAVEGNNIKFLGKLLNTTIHRECPEDCLAVQILPPFCLSKHHSDVFRYLENMETNRSPLNVWIYNILEKPAGRIIHDVKIYEYVFIKLEILIALNYAFKVKTDHYWVPAGIFGYNNKIRERIFVDIEESIKNEAEKSIYITSRLFGNSVSECKTSIQKLRDWIPKLKWSY